MIRLSFDVNAVQFDIAFDFQTFDAVGVVAVGESAKLNAVNETLECVRFVHYHDFETLIRLKRELPFGFFRAPSVVQTRIPDDILLVETRIEMKGSLSVGGQKIDVETFGLLFRYAVEDQLFAGRETAVDTGLVRHGVVFPAPIDVVQFDSAFDVQMIDRRQRLTIFKLMRFFQVGVDREFIIVGPDSDVDRIAFFRRKFAFLLFAGFGVFAVVENQFAVLEFGVQNERRVAAGVVLAGQEVKIETFAGQPLPFDEQRLARLEPVAFQTRQIGHLLNRISF